MGPFITALLEDITGTALWTAIAPAAPLIGVAILFAIGYMVLRKSVKGVSKGKAKI